MKTMTAAKARLRFAEVVNHVHYKEEPIVLTRFGRPHVVMIPLAMLRQSPSGLVGRSMGIDELRDLMAEQKPLRKRKKAEP